MPQSDTALDHVPEGGLSNHTDPPIFRIDYLRLNRSIKRLGEKKVFGLIKEAYLTGRIDPYIKRVLLRLPANDQEVGK